MPAPEELTKDELSTLTDALSSLEEELNELLSATEENAQPVKLKDNQGRLSRMDELHNQSILLANRNVTKNRLKAVARAKNRIEEGSYGFCEACDDPISYARLQAYPDASMCIGCKAESETNQ